MVYLDSWLWNKNSTRIRSDAVLKYEYYLFFVFVDFFVIYIRDSVS
ncbi:hypothetical protein A8938_2811 [Algoriphagus zhangzhouensis]|uniref:Uncharacterized protein n=1 Tax=Algoriphagus zhangzhouensis TaxID=1073327 RepID=A0A1M7ZF43_9BACT|nr:hypothetical protein A8938_2811 [Algoriphagus zhangzhouensis]SHO63520.1 hypothetical protein SAMN04488108_2808 [Algoriphagus zhangzhouensis]